MKLIINDDNNVLITGLCAVLSVADHERLMTTSLQGALLASQRYPQAIIITELITPTSGLEASIYYLQYLRKNYPQLKMLVLTSITDKPLTGLIKTLLPGIVLVKKTDPVHALNKAFDKVTSLNSRCTHHEKFPKNKLHLTPREFKMMKWFNAGLKLADIGQRLSLSPKTVSHYRRSVYRKLNCCSEADFAHKLRRIKLAEV